MRKLKVAVYLEPGIKPELGGTFSYIAMLTRAIDDHIFDAQLDVCFAGEESSEVFKKEYICLAKEENLYTRKATNVIHKLTGISVTIHEKAIRAIRRKNENTLRAHNVELLFYPSRLIRVANFPFIINNWDIGHLSTYAFPEMIMNGQLEYREEFYARDIYRALFVCAESATGEQELLTYTRLNKDRIRLLPIFPAIPVTDQAAEIQPDFLLTGQSFFFYPAQFWAHKNHYGLIEAFAIYAKKHPDVKLVLTGSDQGNRRYIEHFVEISGLTNDVLMPGFVSSGQLKWLYKHAIAMIMPTYLGPSNMPLLEAAALGCPVACSDLPGHRELMGDAAHYFKPESSAELVKTLEFLSGIQEKPAPWTHPVFNLENTLKCLDRILLEALPVRKTWGVANDY